MATVYKVRQGEQILDVEGFAALVQMAQEGRLSPDDAVFVPASNRWHYARSIRQLREFFPAVEDPPPPPGKIREMPREPEATNPRHDPTADAQAPGNGSAGGDVVPMRRGRWSPEGKGVAVPVFNYEMDLEPPPAVKPLRFVLVAGFALLLGGSIYLYRVSYAQYIAEHTARIEAELGEEGPAPKDLVLPTGTRRRPVEEATPAPRDTAVVAASTPATVVTAAPTPVPLPAFDAPAARSKVMNATLTSVSRADQLANAIRSDLVKLAVPVRAVQLVPARSKTKGPVPFDMVIDYSLGDDAGNHAVHAKHYWMILAMAGRRTNETKLNLRSVTVRSFRGAKLSSSAQVTADVVKGVAAGSQSPDAVLASFAELTKR